MVSLHEYYSKLQFAGFTNQNHNLQIRIKLHKPNPVTLLDGFG